jgi:hypothetical protein
MILCVEEINVEVRARHLLLAASISGDGLDRDAARSRPVPSNSPAS